MIKKHYNLPECLASALFSLLKNLIIVNNTVISQSSAGTTMTNNFRKHLLHLALFSRLLATISDSRRLSATIGDKSEAVRDNRRQVGGCRRRSEKIWRLSATIGDKWEAAIGDKSIGRYAHPIPFSSLIMRMHQSYHENLISVKPRSQAQG